MNFHRVPVRQWVHRQFDGVDPWASNRTERWSIVVFRMVPVSMVGQSACDNQTVASYDNDIPKKYAVGIYAAKTGRYRILPGVLSTAWRAGQVPDCDLPSLLYQGEEPLRLKNDQPGSLTGAALLQAILIGTIALGIFACYIRLLILS